tara:strand:- start:3470 stop:4309 length:840 start_codon:yes stop_codon:yes gene_type:complete
MKNKILPYKADLYTIFIMISCSLLLYAPQFYKVPSSLILPWLFFSLIFNFIVNLINHNHSHVPTFGFRTLNIFFDFWLTLNRGASAIFIKVIHNMNHHTYSGTDKDWFTPENEGSGIHFLKPFVYLKVTLKKFRTGAKAQYDQMPKPFNQQRTFENIFLVIIIGLCLFNNWKAFIIYTFIPWYFGNMLLVLTNLIFHRHAEPSDPYNISYNYNGNIENYLFLNGGYHTAHHLKPNIHWSKLKQLHESEVAPKIKAKYVRTSMFEHLISEYFMPKRNKEN